MTGRYEMLVEQNADVPMRHGAILRANVYRPDAEARFPVLMTFGPYGKDVNRQAGDILSPCEPFKVAAFTQGCRHEDALPGAGEWLVRPGRRNERANKYLLRGHVDVARMQAVSQETPRVT
jgi:hypothetical protein